MSVILFERREFGSLANWLISTSNLRDVALPYIERMKLKQYKATFGDECANIVCWVDRLYMANQLAYHTTYTYRDGKFEIEMLQDEDIKSNGLNWDNKKLYSFLNSLHYNLFSNGGRCFVSEDDLDRLDSLISIIARKIIDGPTHHGSF